MSALLCSHRIRAGFNVAKRGGCDRVPVPCGGAEFRRCRISCTCIDVGLKMNAFLPRAIRRPDFAKANFVIERHFTNRCVPMACQERHPHRLSSPLSSSRRGTSHESDVMRGERTRASPLIGVQCGCLAFGLLRDVWHRSPGVKRFLLPTRRSQAMDGTRSIDRKPGGGHDGDDLAGRSLSPSRGRILSRIDRACAGGRRCPDAARCVLSVAPSAFVLVRQGNASWASPGPELPETAPARHFRLSSGSPLMSSVTRASERVSVSRRRR
jgi:hypothetical protein